ncbi:PERM1 protein, partial [Turnix velox]|nr:PERM1 protein [Turnix velox]
PSPAVEMAAAVPAVPAREEARGDRAEPGSPDVVRPKVPGQGRKSRKQRGGSALEAAQGDREPAGGQAAGVPPKAPLSSPLTSRRSKGKEKAATARPALGKSEEAGESKRPVPSAGGEEGEPAASAVSKQKGKEPGAESPGKVRAARQPKAGQAGVPALPAGVPALPDDVPALPDDVPALPVPASAAAAPPAAAVQQRAEKLLQPDIVVSFGGDAAGAAGGEPAAGTPGELGPPCFAAGASSSANTLDVTWPEMYEYLFCDSQGEEEGMENSVEGEKTPLEREMSLPELYEYFFNEAEGKRKKVKGKERKQKKFSSSDHTQLPNKDPDSTLVKDSVVISVPEVYEHFFPDGPRNRTGWSGIFSITPASEVKKAVGALKSLLQRHLVRGQAPAPQSLLRRGSRELSLVPLGRGQEQPEALDMALAVRGQPEVPLALTHKDMCLVFCAFASWAVKTSDLQAPDAWKTMFLASFGTLSAIRYFRRQVREGHPQP